MDRPTPKEGWHTKASWMGNSHSSRGTAGSMMNRQDNKLAIYLEVADWIAGASGLAREAACHRKQ